MTVEKPTTPEPLHWTPAMESACRIYLDVVDTSLSVLELETIGVRELRAALEEVSIAADTFDTAIAEARFAKRPESASKR